MNNNTILVIGAVAFLCMLELAAITIAVVDSIRNVAVPMQIINFITIGVTYAITEISHLQGAKTSQEGSAIQVERENKTNGNGVHS